MDIKVGQALSEFPNTEDFVGMQVAINSRVGGGEGTVVDQNKSFLTVQSGGNKNIYHYADLTYLGMTDDMDEGDDDGLPLFEEWLKK